MTTIEIIAQVISILAMAFNILSYQRKTQRGIITFQLFGSSLFAISFLMPEIQSVLQTFALVGTGEINDCSGTAAKRCAAQILW